MASRVTLLENKFAELKRMASFGLAFQLIIDGVLLPPLYKMNLSGTFTQYDIAKDEWLEIEEISSKLFSTTCAISVYHEPVFVTDVDRFILLDVPKTYSHVFRGSYRELIFCTHKPESFVFNVEEGVVGGRNVGDIMKVPLPSILSFIKMGDGMSYSIQELLNGEE